MTVSTLTPTLPPAGAPNVALRDAWGQTLVDLAAEYPDLVVLDGDLANSTKADLFATAVPDRFLEMGIAEQNLIGVAAGMATCGFVPWISTFTAFLTSRALDQIRVVVAQPHLSVKLCGSYSGILTGKTGKTHQAMDDLAVFRAMPGLSVIAPADAVETAAAMRSMMETDGPQYLRLTRDASPVVFPEGHVFRLGRAELLRDGADVGLIGTGTQTIRVLATAELLAERGVEASVLHVPTLKPLDVAAIVALAERTGAVVTVEDHSVIGGLGGAVAECLGEHRPTRMRLVGIKDVFGESAPNDYLLEKHGLTAEHVASTAMALVEGRAS